MSNYFGRKYDGIANYDLDHLIQCLKDEYTALQKKITKIDLALLDTRTNFDDGNQALLMEQHQQMVGLARTIGQRVNHLTTPAELDDTIEPELVSDEYQDDDEPAPAYIVGIDPQEVPLQKRWNQSRGLWEPVVPDWMDRLNTVNWADN